ncbi:MAG: TIGR02757 family protein [Bacteroidales bacterium]|jgi:uncharacterized protein (TIGR02757 family)|nr:TIGR02757 family protein [Bacteroidales bacterium]
MDEKTIKYLQSLAEKYNTKDFIKDDPISFCHRFKDKKDIEIAGFIASWLAYGKREKFLQVLDKIYLDFNSLSPYQYIINKCFLKYKDNKDNLYRFYVKDDFYNLCSHLYNIYSLKDNITMEDVLIKKINKQREDITFIDVLNGLISLFIGVKGVPQDTSSACKRLCMFLRWLVRDDGIVDLGLWHIIDKKDLIIPLDTHVFQIATRLNIINKKTSNFHTAQEITNKMKEVFDTDPTKADFALFGFGVNE